MAKETAHCTHCTPKSGKRSVAFRQQGKTEKTNLSKRNKLIKSALNKNTNCHDSKKFPAKMFLPKKEKS